jgi:hypothetical protein
MGKAYYYFAASLPMIHWAGKPPMTFEDFCSTAKRLLSKEDHDLMDRIWNGNGDHIETDNAVARAWVEFDRNFRNEQTWYRAHQAHKDPLKCIRGSRANEPALREVVHEVAKMTDLLEAEKSLDRTTWQFLNELEQGHYYDLEFLMVYGVKLKILKRHQEYGTSKGREALDGIRAMDLPVEWALS